MASGTLSANAAFPRRALRMISAEAPLGLRMAATIASVSKTIFT
jgi:hypothetical protein